MLQSVLIAPTLSGATLPSGYSRPAANFLSVGVRGGIRSSSDWSFDSDRVLLEVNSVESTTCGASKANQHGFNKCEDNRIYGTVEAAYAGGEKNGESTD